MGESAELFLQFYHRVLWMLIPWVVFGFIFTLVDCVQGDLSLTGLSCASLANISPERNLSAVTAQIVMMFLFLTFKCICIIAVFRPPKGEMSSYMQLMNRDSDEALRQAGNPQVTNGLERLQLLLTMLQNNQLSGRKCGLLLLATILSVVYIAGFITVTMFAYWLNNSAVGLMLEANSGIGWPLLTTTPSLMFLLLSFLIGATIKLYEWYTDYSQVMQTFFVPVQAVSMAMIAFPIGVIGTWLFSNVDPGGGALANWLYYYLVEHDPEMILTTSPTLLQSTALTVAPVLFVSLFQSATLGNGLAFVQPVLLLKKLWARIRCKPAPEPDTKCDYLSQIQSLITNVANILLIGVVLPPLAMMGFASLLINYFLVRAHIKYRTPDEEPDLIVHGANIETGSVLMGMMDNSMLAWVMIVLAVHNARAMGDWGDGNVLLVALVLCVIAWCCFGVCGVMMHVCCCCCCVEDDIQPNQDPGKVPLRNEQYP